jgi:hypothetical protein
MRKIERLSISTADRERLEQLVRDRAILLAVPEG